MREWVHDWYAEDAYRNSAYANPTGPTTGDERVIRGGAWYNLRWPFVRVAERLYDDPALGPYHQGDNGLGFRCAASP